MVADATRFVAGIILVVAGVALAIAGLPYTLSFIVFFVLLGLALVYTGLTATRCPNGHVIVARWSLRYGMMDYCPMCGAPLGGAPGPMVLPEYADHDR